MKASIRKNPYAWVIGAVLVGGLVLSNWLKSTTSKIRSKV